KHVILINDLKDVSTFPVQTKTSCIVSIALIAPHRRVKRNILFLSCQTETRINIHAAFDHFLTEQLLSARTSQDAAHDADTLQRHKVSHVLNVAYGVANLFPDQYVYKALPILDLPDTDITAYLGECSSFVDRAREKGGVVLVHCNAGVSRSTSIVIGYLMMREGLTFDEAYGQAKAARPSIRPNPGFHQQLRGYEP
uniref:Dual specificity phosphatase 19 n=1 Tax=Gasterosteus aculeatus aculeatus TaxID=481459 RepID=A0AAQ4R0T1_GASAC